MRRGPAVSAETCVECWAEPCACSRPAPAPLPVTNIQAKRNAQWLEGAEHGRKAERDRILEILGEICGEYGDAAMDLNADERDEDLASASRRFVDDLRKKLEQAP